ncbi:MAG: chorismate mutase [Rubricoccaceae bacterium]
MLPAALDALRETLCTPPPDPSLRPSPEALVPWRDRIDALDRAVIALLNERARCAAAIGHIKQQLGVPVYAPRREEDVLANVCAANAGPLSEAAVRRLYERVIDETRSLERALAAQNAQAAAPEASGSLGIGPAGESPAGESPAGESPATGRIS